MIELAYYGSLAPCRIVDECHIMITHEWYFKLPGLPEFRRRLWAFTCPVFILAVMSLYTDSIHNIAPGVVETYTFSVLPLLCLNPITRDTIS